LTPFRGVDRSSFHFFSCQRFARFLPYSQGEAIPFLAPTQCFLLAALLKYCHFPSPLRALSREPDRLGFCKHGRSSPRLGAASSVISAGRLWTFSNSFLLFPPTDCVARLRLASTRVAGPSFNLLPFGGPPCHRPFSRTDPGTEGLRVRPFPFF